MALQVIGLSGAAVAVGGATFRAMAVFALPVDYGALGIYRFSWLTGSLSPGAITDSPVWSFRWSDATRLCVVTGLICDGIATLGAFASGFTNALKIFIARSFSASDTGGTAFTLTGNNGKLRTAMPPTLLGDLRGTNTLVLTAGTRTLDTQPIAELIMVLATANVIVVPPGRSLIGGDNARQTGVVVLAQNEGLIGALSLTASGTVQIGLTSTHAEVTAY